MITEIYLTENSAVKKKGVQEAKNRNKKAA